MDWTEQLEDFVNALKEAILTQEDEQLENMREVIVKTLYEQLFGAPAKNINENYIRECDLKGYTLEDYSNDINNLKSVFYNSIVSIKQECGDSQVKQETLDMIYGLIEAYLDGLGIQVGSRTTVNLGFELIHPNAKLPTYAHEGDQGADVYAIEDCIIGPHTFGTMVPTGLKMIIPVGWAVAIRPRSGMSKRSPLRISNAPATIDQLYRGEIKILFDNFSDFPVEIKAGDRIAQLILEKNYQANISQVDSVDTNTERGEGGFGSSGN